MNTHDFFEEIPEPEPDYRWMIERLPDVEKIDLKQFLRCDRSIFKTLLRVRTKIITLTPAYRLEEVAHIRDLNERRDAGQRGLPNAHAKFDKLRDRERKLVRKLRAELFGGAP